MKQGKKVSSETLPPSHSPLTAPQQKVQLSLTDGRVTLHKLNWEDLNLGPQVHLAWRGVETQI